jgi:glycerol-3-phosphate dehydrogenase subunit C
MSAVCGGAVGEERMSSHTPVEGSREGSLQAPTRHPIPWKEPGFYDEASLFQELARVYDICHGCRRCVSLCHAFPTLFDLVDESESMEIDGVAKNDYWKVVDHCYLCDLCYMTKCPYVPPHEWNVDFPHLMLRAKAVKFRQHKTRLRDRLLTSTDNTGRLASIPIVAQTVNLANKNRTMRKLTEKVIGIHTDAILPTFHSNTLAKRLHASSSVIHIADAEITGPKVAIFTTCYGNYNEPEIGENLVAVLQHNDIGVAMVDDSVCCGMPKLELGDLPAVERFKNHNIPLLENYVSQGWAIIAPVPSCVLMFKQELPLLFADDPAVKKVAAAFFDPFEYLMQRHKEGLLKTEFKKSLGKVAYHAACHLRVQNMGLKTRELLALIPDTEIEVIERCTGHNGTYAVKAETHKISMKICRPVVNRVGQSQASYFASDCPMAGHQIENGLADGRSPTHPLTLLRHAYDI